VAPTADFLGGFLGLQIEINNIFQDARFMKTVFAAENNFKLPPDAGK
jgi:hypothetical protein